MEPLLGLDPCQPRGHLETQPFWPSPLANSISKAGSCCIGLTCNAPPCSRLCRVPKQGPATLHTSPRALPSRPSWSSVDEPVLVRAAGAGLLPTEQLTVEAWGGTGIYSELHIVRAIGSQELKWSSGGHAPVTEAFMHSCIWPGQCIPPSTQHPGPIATGRCGRQLSCLGK